MNDQFPKETNPELDKLVLFLQSEQEKLPVSKKNPDPSPSISLLNKALSVFYIAIVGYLIWNRPSHSSTHLSTRLPRLDLHAPQSSLCPLVPIEPYTQPAHYFSDFSAMLAMDRLNHELQRDKPNGALALHIASHFDRFGVSAVPVYASIANKQIEKNDLDGASATAEQICKMLLAPEEGIDSMSLFYSHDRFEFFKCFNEPIHKSLFDLFLNQKSFDKALIHARTPQELENLGKAYLQEENFEMALKSLKMMTFMWDSRDAASSLLDAIIEKALEKKEYSLTVDTILSQMRTTKYSHEDKYDRRLFSTAMNKMTDADFDHLQTAFETLIMTLSPPNQKHFFELLITKYQTADDAAGVARIQKFLSNLDRQIFVSIKPSSYQSKVWMVCDRNKLKSFLSPRDIAKSETPYPDRGNLVWFNTNSLDRYEAGPRSVLNQWPSDKEKLKKLLTI